MKVVRPKCLCKYQRGGGARLDGKVKRSELLINVVTVERPKVLIGLTQNGM
jgi:hypothetical protein